MPPYWYLFLLLFSLLLFSLLLFSSTPAAHATTAATTAATAHAAALIAHTATTKLTRACRCSPAGQDKACVPCRYSVSAHTLLSSALVCAVTDAKRTRRDDGRQCRQPVTAATLPTDCPHTHTHTHTREPKNKTGRKCSAQA